MCALHLIFEALFCLSTLQTECSEKYFSNFPLLFSMLDWVATMSSYTENCSTFRCWCKLYTMASGHATSYPKFMMFPEPAHNLLHSCLYLSVCMCVCMYIYTHTTQLLLCYFFVNTAVPSCLPMKIHVVELNCVSVCVCVAHVTKGFVIMSRIMSNSSFVVHKCSENCKVWVLHVHSCYSFIINLCGSKNRSFESNLQQRTWHILLFFWATKKQAQMKCWLEVCLCVSDAHENETTQLVLFKCDRF